MSKLVKKSQKDQEYEYNSFVKLYTKGKTRVEICDELGLDFSSNRYELLLDKFYEDIQKDTSDKSPLKTFSEYIAKQNMVVQDLEKMKKHHENNEFKNGKGYVSACKAQSDIFDKVIQTGQKLGIIQKTADKLELINGMDPRDMKDPEIEQAIKEHMEKMSRLSKNNNNNRNVVAFTPQNFKRVKTEEDESIQEG